MAAVKIDLDFEEILKDAIICSDCGKPKSQFVSDGFEEACKCDDEDDEKEINIYWDDEL